MDRAELCRSQGRAWALTCSPFLPELMNLVTCLHPAGCIQEEPGCVHNPSSASHSSPSPRAGKTDPARSNHLYSIKKKSELKLRTQGADPSSPGPVHPAAPSRDPVPPRGGGPASSRGRSEEGGLVGGGGQGTFQSSCHILHYHMVLCPKGTSHK